jgi:hypothetical protein
MKNWVVITSKSGKDAEGFPVGEILCTEPDDVNKVIKNKKIADPLIEIYEFEKHCQYVLKIK